MSNLSQIVGAKKKVSKRNVSIGNSREGTSIGSTMVSSKPPSAAKEHRASSGVELKSKVPDPVLRSNSYNISGRNSAL